MCGRKQVVRCLEGGIQRLSESRAVIVEETGRPTVANGSVLRSASHALRDRHKPGEAYGT